MSNKSVNNKVSKITSKQKRDKVEIFIAEILTRSHETISIEIRLFDNAQTNNLPRYISLKEISIISIMKLYLENPVIGTNYRVNRHLNIVKEVYNNLNYDFNQFFSRRQINRYIYYDNINIFPKKRFYIPNMNRITRIFNKQNKYQEKDEETLRLDFDTIRMFYTDFL